MSANLTWVCVWGCAGITCLATPSEVGVHDGNPYSVISDRNIFHLNPPPPPPAPDEPKPVDLPKVALTGFVRKGDAVRVLLAIPPSKDGKDSVTYLTLAPGDRDHDVQLVKIHLEKEEVEILNSGTAQTLTRSNTLASVSSGPRPAGPAGQERGIHRPTSPGFTPPAPFAPPTAGNQRGGSSIVAGGRDSSGAIVSGGGSGGGGSLIAGGGGGYGSQALVSGGLTASQYANAANNVGSQIANSLFNPSTPGKYVKPIPSEPPVPPEVQPVQMLVQKAAMQAAGEGNGPPLPPGMEPSGDE